MTFTYSELRLTQKLQERIIRKHAKNKTTHMAASHFFGSEETEIWTNKNNICVFKCSWKKIERCSKWGTQQNHCSCQMQILAIFPSGQRLHLPSASFVCVNKPGPRLHWPLAQTSAMEMSRGVSTVSEEFRSTWSSCSICAVMCCAMATILTAWLDSSCKMSVSVTYLDWWFCFCWSVTCFA